MKILQVVNIAFEAGGAEKSVRLIKDGMTARGHDIRVFATDHLLDGHAVFADDIVPAIKGAAFKRFLQYAWYREADQRMRQVADESYRVGQQDRPAIRQHDAPRGGVERCERLIGNERI